VDGLRMRPERRFASKGFGDISPVASNCLTQRTALAMPTSKRFAAELRGQPARDDGLHHSFAKIVGKRMPAASLPQRES